MRRPAPPSLSPSVNFLKTSRWRRLALPALLAGVLLLIVVALTRHHGQQDDQAAQPRVVRTVTPQVRDMPIYLDAVGTVVPASMVTVRTQVQGTLATVDFREGQPVQRGDLLATIDDRELRAQLRAAEGALARDRAQLANARRELKRTRALVDIGSASRQQLDAQDTAVKQAQGVVEADTGSAGQLRVQLGYTRITAPIDGIAGLRQVDAGNLVSPGDADGLVTLASTTPTTVKFAVPVAQLAQVVAARKAGEVTVDALARDGGDVLASGTLQAIDNRVDEATGTVMLRARFDDAAGALFPNQFVSARLHARMLDDALVVPLPAIRQGTQGAYVFTVREGKAHLQPVQTGPSLDGMGVVSGDGLDAKAQVVVEGVDALEDGVAVRVASDAPVDTAPADAGR